MSSSQPGNLSLRHLVGEAVNNSSNNFSTDPVMKLIAFGLIALTLGGAAPLQAQQTPARPAAARPAPGTGEIRGVLVDAESNAPIGAAAVAVWSSTEKALV